MANITSGNMHTDSSIFSLVLIKKSGIHRNNAYSIPVYLWHALLQWHFLVCLYEQCWRLLLAVRLVAAGLCGDLPNLHSLSWHSLQQQARKFAGSQILCSLPSASLFWNGIFKKVWPEHETEKSVQV